MNEEQKRMIESLSNIENDVTYISKIVADLQDFTRPIRPNLEKISLREICEGLMLRVDIPGNIVVSCEIDDDSKMVTADKDMVKRILGNLVTNAVQAMPEGGKLSLCVNKENSYVAISVGDTGMGIPDEVKPNLFTPLFTTKSKGQGFGLAVVKRLTEAFNGEITFTSSERKGTTFIVRLPS